MSRDSLPLLLRLRSLLPTDDPIQRELQPISSFFAGVSYYSLRERSDASDLIPARVYKEWLGRFQAERALTESVSLRLIYMLKEDPALLQEFKELTGPEGLDLITRFEIREIPAPSWNGQDARSASVADSYYWLAFEPATDMGGAGAMFFFSQLSLGTRRAIRAITSLLFDKRSLMLMEQPEDSIHPDLLRKLIDVFRSYSGYSQIVFTTHSPEVLDVLDPDEILLVIAPEGKTEARRLSSQEVLGARRFLKNDGSLSEYIEISAG